MLQLPRHSYLLILSGLWITPAFGEDSPILSLADAIEKALNRHAAIPAADAKRQSAEGLAVQNRFRPNPTFTFQMENWRFDGLPAFRPGYDVDWFAFVSQSVEAGGKRARRADVGKQSTGLATLELELVKWNVRQEVRQAYYRALLAQKQLQIMVENNESFQRILDYHRFRVREGAMAETDLIKVELEAERLSLQRETATLESERSRFELLKAIGEPAAAVRFPPASISTVLEATNIWGGQTGVQAKSRTKRLPPNQGMGVGDWVSPEATR